MGDLMIVPNKDRLPLRVILTEILDMDKPRTHIRATWFTDAGSEDQIHTWNWEVEVDGLGLPLDSMVKDVQTQVMFQWRLAGDHGDPLPWPEMVITLVEEHSRVAFVTEGLQ